MNLHARIAAALLALTLLSTGHAPAMSILRFARMNLDDQATYITALVEGAAHQLRAAGHPDQAQKAIDLFKDPSKQGGLNQLAMNLKNLQIQNIHNGDNPNNRIPDADVEAAMELTLRDNGITLPAGSLKNVNHDFHPMFPPRSHNDGQ
jgi:hypothetical protein